MSLFNRVIALLLATVPVAGLPSDANLGADPSIAAQEWNQAFAKSGAGGQIAYYKLSASGNADVESTVPLLVISGGPGSDHRYMHAAGAFEQLAKQRRVVMYDQRATGASAPATAQPVIDDWVQDIEAVRTALDVEMLDLLGHSFGGYLAMSYAVAHGARVRSLVLVDSAAPDLAENVQLLPDLYPERIDEWGRIRAELPDQFPAEAIALFLSMEFVDPAWIDRYLAHVRRLTYNVAVNNALRQDMQQRELAARVAEISQPVLLLHGRYDAVLAPSTSWKIHQQLPNSRFAVIEQSGHLPFVEQPEVFIAEVLEFLQALDEATP